MKMKSLIKSVAGVAVVAALAVAGCDKKSNNNNGGGTTSSGGNSGKPLKLAFVTNNASEFWKIASNGVHKYENEAKVQVDINQPTNGKTEEQNQILENLVSQNYDAVAVSVIAPKDQIGILNRTAGKTKLLTFDSDADQSNRLLYIGSLNYNAGKQLGEKIVQLLPQGGKMAVFVGTFSADNAAQRLKGIEDAIKGHKIEIVEKREDQTDRNAARTNVEAVLNAHSDLKLVSGLWSYNGPAIAMALDGSGKKGKVLAAVFDDEDGTIKGIESGTITCTVVQHPYDMGYETAKWMHKLATDFEKAKAEIPANKIIDTGTEVVTKDNLAEYQKRLAEWKKQP